MGLDNAYGVGSLKPGVCTSTTRPSSPFEGQVIFETDTNTLAVYDGSGWVSLNPVDRDRNVIINGAMQIAQRGTSVTGITATGYYTVDRFDIQNGNLGTWTASQESDAPTGSGFRKSAKLLCTTADSSLAAGDFLTFRQRIEGQNLQKFAKGTASAKPFTISFWVKSNVTGTYIVNLLDGDNSRSVSASYSISASATWEKKTITFPADTTGAFDNDNGASMNVVFWLATGSTFSSGTLNTSWESTVTANRAVGQTNLASATNNYWQITGVQLEAGAVATPFEFEDYSTTLAKCQRYYYKAQSTTAGNRISVGYNRSTTISEQLITFPVTMRTAPSALEQSGTAGDYSVLHGATATNCSVVPSFNSAEISQATIFLTVASGLTTGQGSLGRAVTTDAYFAWSAEL